MLDLDLKPDVRKLRTFGRVALVAFVALGALIAWRGGLFGIAFGAAAMPVGLGAIALGVLSGALSALRPGALLPLYVALTLITWPIGLVASYLILGFLYYGVFALVAAIFRAIGRDPLERRFEPARASYWVPHGPPPPARRYLRQF